MNRIGIVIDECRIKNILKECKKYKPFHSDKIFKREMVEVGGPEDIIGIDLMNYIRKWSIVLAIDYFTRMNFAKSDPIKEAEKIVTFLEEMQKKLTFKDYTVIMLENSPIRG